MAGLTASAPSSATLALWLRRALAELAKLCMAIGIVVALVGGYTVWHLRRLDAIEAASPLPNTAAATGPCTLWFVGSSTMFKWSDTLDGDLKPWDARARGANGASIPRVIDRFALEPRGRAPAAILFYSGENDIARGVSPAETFAEFRRFIAAKTRRYGDLPTIVLSLKPSPARLGNLPEQTAYNDSVRRFAAARRDLHFVDIRPLMFRGGRLAPLYLDDGIHMNAAGYARWGQALRPALAQALPAATVERCLHGPTRG